MSSLAASCCHSLSGISNFLIPKNFQFTGRIAHPDGSPLHDQKLKLYLDLYFLKVPLASTYTDKAGDFTFDFRATKLPFQDQALIVEVVEDKLKSPSSFFSYFRSSERGVDELKINHKFTDERFSCPGLVGELYEYASDLPILQQPEDRGQRPQQWGLGWYADLLKYGGSDLLKDVYFKRFRTNASIDTLMESYGVNRTMLHSPEATLELIFNGIYPCDLLSTQEQGIYAVEINWDDYEKKNDPVLPNTQLLLSFEDDQPKIEKVIIQYPGEHVQEAVPGNHMFNNFLYHFNCSAFYMGEIASHLATGHINTEQYAMAAFRHLNCHPLGNLLKPHLREVTEIDHAGKTAIFGSEGILAEGPLTVKGIRDCIRDQLRKLCYSNFRPRTVLFEGHRYAKASNKYWEILDRVVGKFFDQNNIKVDDPDTIKKWHQIYYMSESLVNHSPAHREQDHRDYSRVYDPSEADNPDFPGREVRNGELRSMRPITLNQEAPSAEDIIRLKQFCMHAIFQSTFQHWWVHSSQKIWGMQMQLASLAPKKNGELPYGDTESGAAQHQISIAKILTVFKRGVLVENPNKEIFRELITELFENEVFFREQGLDIHWLPYGVFI